MNIVEEAKNRKATADALRAEKEAAQAQADQLIADQAQANADSNMAKEARYQEAARILQENKIPPKSIAGMTPPARIGGGYNTTQLEQALEHKNNQPQPVAPVAQEPVAPAQPAAPVERVPAEQQPSFAPSAYDYGMSLAKRGVQQQLKGEEIAAKAEEEAALKEASILANQQKEIEDRKLKFEAEEAKAKTELSKLEEDYQNTKITEPSLWAKSTTGGKIMLILGAIFSAASPSSAQAFRANIQRRIDDDLNMQKAELEKKRGLISEKKGVLSQMYQRYKDGDTAMIAANKIYLDRIGAELKARLATAKTPMAKAKMDLLLAEWQKVSDNANASLLQKQMELGAKLAENQKPKELNSSDKARKDNLMMALTAVKDVKKALKAGVNTFSLVGDNDFTIAAREFAEGIGRMQSGGVIGDEEAENFMQMLPTAKDTRDIQQKKIVRLEKMLNSRLNTLGIESPDDVQAQKEAALGIR